VKYANKKVRESIYFTTFELDFWNLKWYNKIMQKIDMKGLSPDQIEYITSLEEKVESQQIRINQLMDMLLKTQKALYGRSSEKRCYVLGEESDQISLFNEAEAETSSKAEEPTVQTIVSSYSRKAKRTRRTGKNSSCGGNHL